MHIIVTSIEKNAENHRVALQWFEATKFSLSFSFERRGVGGG